MQRLRHALGPLHRATKCLPWRLASAAGISKSAQRMAPVQFVIENADWAIRWVGEHVRDEVNALSPAVVATTVRPHRLMKKVVHFGSQYMWLAWGPHMARSNRYVVSFFHGKREDGPEVAAHIDRFLESVPRLHKIVTASSVVEKRLLSWGVPAERIARIPIGVDTNLFVPPDAAQRHAARARFGIPESALVIGSFQKDGIGWGDGMVPKSIKGPDIFLDTLRHLKADFPVVAFLTGPARGFVKKGLEDAGIPYVHTYAQSHAELAACYHALDLYVVSSREEGGPMGLMESMASGIPVVSTAVGMAPDLIEDGVLGGLVDTTDGAVLADRARSVVPLAQEADFAQRVRAAVMCCDWSEVGRGHWEQVYRPLLG